MPVNIGETVVSGTLANGESSVGHRMGGPFMFGLSGTWVGSVALEASLDDGVTYQNCVFMDGTPNGWTSNGVVAVPEAHARTALYRLTATLSSGSVGWRFAR